MFKKLLILLLLIFPSSYVNLSISSVSVESNNNIPIGNDNAYMTVKPRKNDTLLLSKIINGEAIGESKYGKLLVGSVIINRINHGNWPNTIKEVIYQPRQFNGINNNNFKSTLKTYDLARQLLIYGSIEPDIYYFNTTKINDNVLIIEGNHIFSGLFTGA